MEVGDDRGSGDAEGGGGVIRERDAEGFAGFEGDWLGEEPRAGVGERGGGGVAGPAGGDAGDFEAVGVAGFSAVGFGGADS